MGLMGFLANNIMGVGVAAFLIGAIPFSQLVAKSKGINLRDHGSGNLGATNVYRALGFKYALLVFLLDMAKGFFLTALAMRVFEPPYMHIGIGLLTVVGHSLSPFVGFKGGKGAATGVGVILAISPLIFAITAIWIVFIIWITRMVSVGSISACVLVPWLLWLMHYPPEYVSVVSCIASFIILRHRSNIRRILKGEENKI